MSEVCLRVTTERKWIVGRRSWPLEHHVYFRSLCTCKCRDNNGNKAVSDLRKWRSRFQKGHRTTAIPYAEFPWNGQGGIELTWGRPPFLAAWGTSRKINLYLSYDCGWLEFQVKAINYPMKETTLETTVEGDIRKQAVSFCMYITLQCTKQYFGLYENAACQMQSQSTKRWFVWEMI